MNRFAGPNVGIGDLERLLTMAGGKKPPPLPAGYGEKQMIFQPSWIR